MELKESRKFVKQEEQVQVLQEAEYKLLMIKLKI